MLWLLIALGLLSPAPAAAAPSNILLLIADDIGVEATAFYPLRPRLSQTTPPPPPSPNLRALAGKGVLFTSAWGMPLCAPARAAIFTGRYGFRTGMGTNPNAEGLPRLARDEIILPEPFAARPGLGYLLGAIGKWHVSDGVV
jgi:arylsulfatase A-like enzyme